MSDPIAYLITFHTYGTWLHGDPRGSVDRHHNVYGTEIVGTNAPLRAAEASKLNPSAVTLTGPQRQSIRRTIDAVSDHLHWTFRAANVRTNHVHVVVEADALPERVMNTIKAWATRRLRNEGLFPKECKLWTRHGSTRYLWKPDEVFDACRYVAEGQGEDLD